MSDAWIGEKGLLYSDFVVAAAQNSDVFSTFRRQKIYRSIVETLDADEGEAFFDAIEDPIIRSLCLKSAPFDKIGSPLLGTYDGVQLSPTTPRYGKVISDLKNFFPHFDAFKEIVEIGVGYGGLVRLLSAYKRETGSALERCIGLDLPSVALLAGRYIEECGGAAEAQFTTLENVSLDRCDLVVSNFAFSEFSKSLQKEYLENVIMKARSGYLTMNTGLWRPFGFDHECYSVEELLSVLPNAALAYDRPASATENYILVFGDHRLGDGVSLEDIRAESQRSIDERKARRSRLRFFRNLRMRLPKVIGG